MKKLLTSLAAMAAFGLTASASAQKLTMSPYLGAAGGVASWNVDCSSAATECKTKPGTFKVYGGVNVSPNTAVELSVSSLGKVTAKSPTQSAEMKATSYDLAAVYRMGASTGTGLGGFVKGGLGYTQAKTSGMNGTVATSGSKNSVGLVLGAGVTYAFTPNLALRAEIDTRKVDVGSSSGNVTSFLVGGQASF